MKWETIKKNCVRQMATENRNMFDTGRKMLLLAQLRVKGYNKSSRQFNKDVEDKLAIVIENWDVRQWNDLKNVFPKCFPRHIHSIELTEKGWELI